MYDQHQHQHQHDHQQQHYHQHQHQHQHENLTDAHHAWTWGAVWRGGEGGDLAIFFIFSENFLPISNFFFISLH